MTDARTTRASAVALAVALLITGCASQEVKLLTDYEGKTPPNDLQPSRVTLVQATSHKPGVPLEQVASDYLGIGQVPWGKQTKLLVEDSLRQMQIEYQASDQSYSGSGDLPTLLDAARDNDTEYLLVVESDVKPEGDNAFGGGTLSVEVNTIVGVYRVADGERLFYRDYIRKASRGGVATRHHLALQFATSMAARQTNLNLQQFWEDIAFELRLGG